MPKPNERKRLKDRIVDSISRAVKQVSFHWPFQDTA